MVTIMMSLVVALFGVLVVMVDYDNLSFEVLIDRLFLFLFSILGLDGVLIAILVIIVYLDKYLKNRNLKQ